MENQLTELIDRLKRIAAANDDEFKFRIDIDARNAALRFTFEAFETADGHTFVSGSGHTLQEMVDNAAGNVD